jgi:cullin 4
MHTAYLHVYYIIQVRLLKKEPPGREVDDDDTFTFDTGFKHKLLRIKINTIQLKETVEENTKTHEAVFRDRQYQVCT